MSTANPFRDGTRRQAETRGDCELIRFFSLRAQLLTQGFIQLGKRFEKQVLGGSWNRRHGRG